MRRPVQRVGAIAMMIAGMMGAGAQAQGSSVQGIEQRSERIGTRKESKRTLPGSEKQKLRLRPQAAKNQRQFRKKWRMSPHHRPIANRH